MLGLFIFLSGFLAGFFALIAWVIITYSDEVEYEDSEN